MSSLQFRIQHPNGRGEQLVVDSDQVLIGSGAHCEIRLPPEHSAVEHVMITFLGGAVYAQARWMNPPPTINGSPFTQAPILPESILTIGHVQIAIAVVDGVDGANVIQKKSQKTSPTTLVLAAIIFPAAIFLLMEEDSGYGVGEVPETPPLWGAPVAACPQQAKDLALNLAREKRVLGDSRRERCPFFVQDCVNSPPAYELAAACFKAAGEEEMAKDTAAVASQLRTRVNEEYRAHQMRLEHTIMVGDLRTAQGQVRFLLKMLDGQNGPYVTWLSNHERKLALRLGKIPEKF